MTDRTLCKCSFWTGRAGAVHYRREGCTSQPTTPPDAGSTEALVIDLAARTVTNFQPVVDALAGIVRDLAAGFEAALNTGRKP